MSSESLFYDSDGQDSEPSQGSLGSSVDGSACFGFGPDAELMQMMNAPRPLHLRVDSACMTDESERETVRSWSTRMREQPDDPYLTLLQQDPSAILYDNCLDLMDQQEDAPEGTDVLPHNFTLPDGTPATTDAHIYSVHKAHSRVYSYFSNIGYRMEEQAMETPISVSEDLSEWECNNRSGKIPTFTQDLRDPNSNSVQNVPVEQAVVLDKKEKAEHKLNSITSVDDCLRFTLSRTARAQILSHQRVPSISRRLTRQPSSNGAVTSPTPAASSASSASIVSDEPASSHTSPVQPPSVSKGLVISCRNLSQASIRRMCKLMLHLPKLNHLYIYGSNAYSDMDVNQVSIGLLPLTYIYHNDIQGLPFDRAPIAHFEGVEKVRADLEHDMKQSVDLSGAEVSDILSLPSTANHLEALLFNFNFHQLGSYGEIMLGLALLRCRATTIVLEEVTLGSGASFFLGRKLKQLGCPKRVEETKAAKAERKRRDEILSKRCGQPIPSDDAVVYGELDDSRQVRHLAIRDCSTYSFKGDPVIYGLSYNSTILSFSFNRSGANYLNLWSLLQAIAENTNFTLQFLNFRHNQLFGHVSSKRQHKLIPLVQQSRWLIDLDLRENDLKPEVEAELRNVMKRNRDFRVEMYDNLVHVLYDDLADLVFEYMFGSLEELSQHVAIQRRGFIPVC